jgi:hypothetical protein
MRRNLTIYQSLPLDFVCAESWWHLLNGNLFTIREGTWLFTKDSLSILFARNSDGIYWMKLFHHKRRNLTAYANLLIDFICTKSWWHLLDGNFSTIREGTWPFTKDSLSILFARSPDGIYWREVFHDKGRNLTIYETLLTNLICT